MVLAEASSRRSSRMLVVITVLRSVRIVPQARARNVERLGRYRKTLEPGMNFIIPFIDRVKPLIDLREQVVSFTGAPVITEDNLVVLIDTVLFFQVTDPRAADYEIVNYIQAIEQITATMLRSVIGSMDLEQTLTSRDKINAMLRGVLDDASGKWGIRVTRVEIKAIDPPKSVKDAMEKQMRAEREKRAAILTAEGVRQSKILTAEGEKQSAILTAEGVKQAKILTARRRGAGHRRGVPGRARQRPRPQAARLPVPADAAATRARRGQHVLGHPERGHVRAPVRGERLRRRTTPAGPAAEPPGPGASAARRPGRRPSRRDRRRAWRPVPGPPIRCRGKWGHGGSTQAGSAIGPGVVPDVSDALSAMLAAAIPGRNFGRSAGFRRSRARCRRRVRRNQGRRPANGQRDRSRGVSSTRPTGLFEQQDQGAADKRGDDDDHQQSCREEPVLPVVGRVG